MFKLSIDAFTLLQDYDKNVVLEKDFVKTEIKNLLKELAPEQKKSCVNCADSREMI